jgi:hypothetical protein
VPMLILALKKEKNISTSQEDKDTSTCTSNGNHKTDTCSHNIIQDGKRKTLNTINIGAQESSNGKENLHDTIKEARKNDTNSGESLSDQPINKSTKITVGASSAKLDFTIKNFSFQEIQKVVLPDAGTSHPFSNVEDNILVHVASMSKYKKGKKNKDWDHIQTDYLKWCRYFTLSRIQQGLVVRTPESLRYRYKKLSGANRNKNK